VGYAVEKWDNTRSHTSAASWWCEVRH